jgi:predicted HTH domain antitoxin
MIQHRRIVVATLHIDLPNELVAALNETDVQAVREAALVKLYDRGRLSSGKAAELLGISRREFLELLGQHGVSYFDETMDVAAEARIG